MKFSPIWEPGKRWNVELKKVAQSWGQALHRCCLAIWQEDTDQDPVTPNSMYYFIKSHEETIGHLLWKMYENNIGSRVTGMARDLRNMKKCSSQVLSWFLLRLCVCGQRNKDYRRVLFSLYIHRKLIFLAIRVLKITTYYYLMYLLRSLTIS